MTSAKTEPRLFTGDAESCDFVLPNGLVSIRSLRAPRKESPNEDAAAVLPLADGALVLAVADGVGGSPAGCDASRQAIQTLKKAVTRVDVDVPLRDVILDAMEKANHDILHSGKRSATTLVVAELRNNALRCFHAGDSEMIVAGQRGRIKHRIIPHSPTGFAVEAGLLAEEEAVFHEERHIVFNVMGMPDMRVDVSPSIEIAPRDTVLLTTDGVLDNLYIDEVVNIIRAGPINRAADELVRATRERMENNRAEEPSKPDDLTIILYRRFGRLA